MTIEVYADELLRLTVDDLGDNILVAIKDPENETEKHLAHLRKLFEQRAEKELSQSVKADELEARLGRLPPRGPTLFSRSYSLSSTSTFDTEKDREEGWREEQEAYRDLLAEGGRPSHPVSLGPDVIDLPGEYEQYKDILWFWHFGGTGIHQEYRYQLITWREFRDYQDKKREFYVPQNRFQEYENAVRESQADVGCKWDLKVLEDRNQQNRLEDWNEFRAFYYRRLKMYKKASESKKQNLLLREKELEDAQARGTDVITDPQVLFSRSDEIMALERDMTEAKSRVESAETELKAARRNKSKRKATLIRSAQQELSSAKDNLKNVSGSDEMRRLCDGYVLHIAQGDVTIAKGELGAAQLQVKRWEVFLKWVDDQYHTFAAECGYLTNDNVDNVSQNVGERNSFRRPRLRPRPLQRKGAQPKSVLSPNSSSRVSKPSKVKSFRRHKSQPLDPGLLPTTTAQQQPVGTPNPPRRSTRLQLLKNRQTGQVPEMSALHPVHSVRVTKVQATSHTTKGNAGPGRLSAQNSCLISKPRPPHSQTSPATSVKPDLASLSTEQSKCHTVFQSDGKFHEKWMGRRSARLALKHAQVRVFPPDHEPITTSELRIQPMKASRGSKRKRDIFDSGLNARVSRRRGG